MYPKYVEIKGERYPINTSYIVAIECNNISEDESIGKFEKGLAIIYKLFGDKGLKATNNYDELLRLGFKYLACGQELEETKTEPDMDYNQDMAYIKTSFKSDYNMELTDDMHWWEFNDLINGLSDSELGNCCILNKIRNIRTMDTSDIKDPKQLEQIISAKKRFALKKKDKELSKKEKDSIDKFYELTGIER